MSTETQVFPYSRCQNCSEEFADPSASNAHLTVTHAESSNGRSHTVTVVNPTPEERAQREVDSIVEDAISECMDKLDRAIDRGRLTAEQVVEGLNWHSDFADAWSEYVEENPR